ncbi:hypothetical protein A3H65_03660 [Candidatus Giovannonibacteria bacterium RIFCSPLOWO2_02_FULL_45_14]|uniref:Magnesium transport protein CorA n=1 Tax=Candidatus Giovannonibacteria bacterium RIFCSPLOWO2_12_FULL_44_15 TaxID=1798364 RepID=A0A1F5Y0P3_9BACT|nr:MAG: hypothetical protein A3C75_03580 [Candidatus Giovannonibacteria bacterium RIFCSPHIGHO2_02_FULL_44_31]OGF75995.1 MAG: hypothetical protein A3E62_01680 [Candidatus Giovannonibacteria bacterium RIFCSPHIGHO2_12_FULL_44_29]OGF90762.1 MAG: hypothetical protein A3H65_03660 [Candidatus Giovannonibacteria bacterium RIFCSPLOWO2_02_FULL_45_14]OGF93663.1 MAG: hypothetical protein A3G54_03955 [Candidatus Giovannonibacteria bacterium RIFCSPLOWO2_12_FULL_44_15]
MLSRIEQGGVLWVDAYKPSPNEISELAREFLLPRPISEEISRPSFHPRAEIHGKYLYLILPLPVYDHNKEHHHSRELDIVVGEKFLLTIHYEPIESIQNIFGKIQTNLKLRSELFEKDSSKILFYMWGRAYDYLLSELDHIQKKIDRIEDRIFSVERKELIEEISLLRRDILDFSRSIRPHGMVMEEFTPIARSTLGPDFVGGMRELTQIYRRIILLAENDKDSLEVLYDTYNALQSRRSTETVKIFTMLALLTFPLSLIATIFAIDTVSRPIVGLKHDFWIIIGIMVLVVFGMLIFFRSRKWI